MEEYQCLTIIFNNFFYRFPDANNYNKYVVVLHLAANGNGNSKNLKDFKKLKFKKPNDLIRTYASCKEA